MLPTFYLWANWDPEGGVRYTAESTIAGLNSSGETLEELRERLLLLIPDFLEDEMPQRARLHIIAERADELTRDATRLSLSSCPDLIRASIP